jgi:hypothetical protein
MTHQRDAMFDDRLADWLEDDPALAPAQILETVIAALPSIPQRPAGLSSRWLGRGLTARLAMAAALVVAVALVALTLFTGPSVGPPNLSPTPTSPPSTPAFGLAGEMVAFTSSWYGYSIDRPAEWSVRPATEQLSEGGVPWIDSNGVDYVAAYPIASVTPGIIVVGARLSPGRTLQAWTDITTVMTCGEPASREPVELDGETGTLLSYPDCFGLHHLWVTVVHRGVGYHIIWIGGRGTEAADRALFDRMLATFRFPAGPPASPAPSA